MRNDSRRQAFLCLRLLITLLGVFLTPGGAVWMIDLSAETGSRPPVLVELFTSEGCSNCPPADELLIRLETEQPVPDTQIIAVSEHVDYWNGLGWRDPFSSTVFTERQEGYRRALAESASYTPQLVVDGHTALVGSLEDEIRRAIAEAADRSKAILTLRHSGFEPRAGDGGTLEVGIVDIPIPSDGDRVELWYAITESGLSTSVSRGENARRRLRHTAVARQLERVEALPAVLPKTYDTTISLALSSNWNRDHLRAVVFLQQARGRQVIGVAQVALTP